MACKQRLDKIVGPHPVEQRAFKKLFSDLYLVQPDGSLTTPSCPKAIGRRLGRSHAVPPDARLGRRPAGPPGRLATHRLPEERRYVSLGHDALARLAAQWKEELTRSERLRKQLQKVLAWSAAAAAVLTVVGLILLVQKRSADAKMARIDVAGVLEARPDAVPYAIRALVAGVLRPST